MTTTARGPANCVVFHPEHADPPRELLSALRRRGMDATTTDDPFGAMAECCLRRAEGILVLLLAEPGRLRDGVGRPRLAEFLDTFAKYVPASAVWVYEEDASPELRGFADADAAALLEDAVEDASGTSWSTAGASGRASGRASETASGTSSRTGPRGAAPSGPPALRLVDGSDDETEQKPEPKSEPKSEPKPGPGFRSDHVEGAGLRGSKAGQSEPDQAETSDDAGNGVTSRSNGATLSDDEMSALLNEP